MKDTCKDLDSKKFLKAVMDIKNDSNTDYIFADELREKFKDIINKLEEYEQLDDLLNNTTVKELIHIIHEYRTGGKHEEN